MWQCDSLFIFLQVPLNEYFIKLLQRPNLALHLHRQQSARNIIAQLISDRAIHQRASVTPQEICGGEDKNELKYNSVLLQ